MNERQPKPRAEEFTEICGRYYTLMQTRCFEDLRDTMSGRCELRFWPEMADEAVAKGCLSSTMVKRAAADPKIKEHRKRSPPHDVESGLC